MCKLLNTVIAFTLFCSSLKAQNPYIMTVPGSGLGQYGYVENNATSFVRLNSNTFGNIDYMRARFWADGSEFIYNTFSGGCGGAGTELNTTTDYAYTDLPNWDIGEFAYVSVYACYCGGGCSHSPGSIGFNERKFFQIDVSTDNMPTLDNIVEDNGQEFLVGSFTINTGGVTAIDHDDNGATPDEALLLDRFWIYNVGDAEETNDIPNDGISLYYEPITGSETFDGTESSAIIYGDYGGNSTTNGEFGHDDLNIAIPSSGLRVYVVVTDLASTFTSGRTVDFTLLNDGMSLEPSNQGFRDVRVGEISFSNSTNIVLPVEWLSFNAKYLNTQAIQLDWITLTEINNKGFYVQRSIDGVNFDNIAWLNGNGNTAEEQHYQYLDYDVQPNFDYYYRLKQVDYNAAYDYSPIVAVNNFKSGELASKENCHIYPNPTNGLTTCHNQSNQAVAISVYSMQGKLVYKHTVPSYSVESINLSYLPRGLYTVSFKSPYYQKAQKLLLH